MRPCLHVRQQPAPDPRQRGYSKFEFAVAAALFALLVGFAANRLNAYQEDAESVAAQQLIVSVRGALRMKLSQLTASQRRHEIGAMLDENPLGWLYEKPKNYLGEFYAPDAQKLAPGNWYFDRQNKTLVYLLTRRNSFAPRSLILLKFKVESLRLPTLPAQTMQPAAVENVSLIQVFDQSGVNGQ